MYPTPPGCPRSSKRSKANQPAIRPRVRRKGKRSVLHKSTQNEPTNQIKRFTCKCKRNLLIFCIAFSVPVCCCRQFYALGFLSSHSVSPFRLFRKQQDNTQHTIEDGMGKKVFMVDRENGCFVFCACVCVC